MEIAVGGSRHTRGKKDNLGWRETEPCRLLKILEESSDSYLQEIAEEHERLGVAALKAFRRLKILPKKLLDKRKVTMFLGKRLWKRWKAYCRKGLYRSMKKGVTNVYTENMQELRTDKRFSQKSAEGNSSEQTLLLEYVEASGSRTRNTPASLTAFCLIFDLKITS